LDWNRVEEQEVLRGDGNEREKQDCFSRIFGCFPLRLYQI